MILYEILYNIYNNLCFYHIINFFFLNNYNTKFQLYVSYDYDFEISHYNSGTWKVLKNLSQNIDVTDKCEFI